MKMLALTSVLIATTLVSFSALAETKAKSTTVETYDFPDDKLLSVKGATDGMTVGGNRIPVRTILARPRTHFVPELLKTIEGL